MIAPERPGSTDRNLVAALRAELATVEPARTCCRAAELAGLDATGDRPRSSSVSRLRLRLGRPDPGDAAFDWSTAAEHCRTAYLRGRFLGSGSLSLSGGRAHLEFVVAPEEAERLVQQLAGFGFRTRSRVRRGRGVVTSKSAETVASLLRLLGATGAVLELEARAVTRTLNGDLNRVLNAEGANLHRQVDAARRQLDAIAVLEADGRLSRLPESLREIAAARREAPEATFTELALRLNRHRSLVQRSLTSLETLAEKPRESPAPR